jgi:hypothetical protein
MKNLKRVMKCECTDQKKIKSVSSFHNVFYRSYMYNVLIMKSKFITIIKTWEFDNGDRRMELGRAYMTFIILSLLI